MNAFSLNVYLGSYIFAFILQLVCTIVNGTIITLFLKLQALRKNKNLRLVWYLSIGHFFAAIFGLPYFVYMILNWNPTQLNFDPLFIIISAAPLPMNLKFSATITIGIALSRNTAVCFPGLFRRMEQRYYSEIVGLIAGVLGLVDAVLSITLSPVVQIANCGTTGCFVGSSFLFYWGISNMFLGLVVIALSASLLLKMKDIDGKSSTASVTGSQKSKFQQANKTATGVLISSLIFFTIPSLFVGIVQLIGISFFKLIGPFYYTSLLLSGIFSGIVFLISNNDARRVIAGQPTNHSTQVTSIFVKRVAGT